MLTLNQRVKGLIGSHKAKGEGSTGLTDRVLTSPGAGIWRSRGPRGCGAAQSLAFISQNLRPKPRGLSEALDSGSCFPPPGAEHTCPVVACGVNFSVSRETRQLETCQKLTAMSHVPAPSGCAAAGA